MKLPNGVNPAHVASKDQTRYVLNGVQFAHGLATATNGRCLVAAIATREDDDDAREAIVPTRAVMAGIKTTPSKRTGRRNTAKTLPRLTINPKPEENEGTVTITDARFDTITVRDLNGNFPRIEQVFNDRAKHTLKLGICIKHLADISKALGDESLVLHLDPDGFEPCENVPKAYRPAIYITRGEDAEECVAILMPMRVSTDHLAENRVVTRVGEIKIERSLAEAAAFEKLQAQVDEVAAAQPENPNPAES